MVYFVESDTSLKFLEFVDSTFYDQILYFRRLSAVVNRRLPVHAWNRRLNRGRKICTIWSRMVHLFLLLLGSYPLFDDLDIDESKNRKVIHVKQLTLISFSLSLFRSNDNAIKHFFKKRKWAHPGLFFVLFSSFHTHTHYNFYNTFMWKNVHPGCSAGIRTHDLQKISLFS